MARKNNTQQTYPLTKLFPLFFILGVFIVCLVSYKWMDNDLLAMLTTGDRWRESGVITENVFTFVPDLDFIAEQWLWCVVLSWLYQTAGPLGMFIFNCSLTVIFYFLCYVFLRLFRIEKFLALLMAFFVAAVYPYHNLRPQMISIILLILQLYCTEKARNSKNFHWLFLLPLIMLVEINIHAPLWTLHILLILPFFIPLKKDIRFFTAEPDFPGFRKWLGINTVLTAGMMFVNPYGLKMITYILAFIVPSSFKNGRVTELRAVTFSKYGIIPFLLSALILIAAIYMIKKRKKQMLSRIVLICMLLAISFTSLKQTQFALISYLYLIAIWAPGFAAFSRYTLTNSAKNIICVIITVLCMVCIPTYFLVGECNTKFFTQWDNIVQKMRAASDSDDIRVFTTHNTGNAMEYNGFSVYVDSRSELFAPWLSGGQDILAEYYRYSDEKYSEEEFRELLDRYQCEYIVCAKENKYFDIDGWELFIQESIRLNSDTEVYIFRRTS